MLLAQYMDISRNKNFNNEYGLLNGRDLVNVAPCYLESS
jgi:hypothetical protein